jgi:aubergine
MERIIAQNSSIMESEYFFPKRSQINTTGKKLELAANYFRFEFLDKNKRTFYKYSVQFEPELPGDSRKLRAKIFSKARDELKQYLGHCIFNNTTVYSLENRPDKIEVTVDSNSQSYIISLSLTNIIEADNFEAESLYKKFFSCLVKKIKFIQLRKNFFNSQCAKFLNNHQKLEIWPGFNSSVNIMQEGTLLNMNLVYRVVRPETAWDRIKNLSTNCHLGPGELENMLEEFFKGVAVLTRYNSDKVYIIDGIDMTKSPKDKFDTKNGPVSYLEYYKTKYGHKIQNTDQPLLIHRDKRTGMEIRLIPELCYLTGLTDEMRANFNLMKELSAITKGNAQEKLKECRDLINQFNSNNDCQQEMKNWGLTINNTPLTLSGTRITAGNYLMHKKQDGNRYSFAIDDAPDVDRKIQAEMFSQPALNTWAIFATMKDEGLATQFVDTMKQVQGTFNYQMRPPAVFLVKSQNYRDWEAEISRTLENNKNNVQAVVLIIPGNRGKGQLYNDVKRLLMGKFPIPSQVVLSGTLAKGKYFKINFLSFSFS